MANKTRTDLNKEILDIVKSNPGATDNTKLKGIEHRNLLKDILDYIDEQVATATAISTGNFPFDWTVPSNAFNNYSNGETTFAPGMWKFLHRDEPPKASLSASDAVRQNGSSTAVQLTYAAAAGSSALASIEVDGTTVALAPPYGTVSRNTAANTTTNYSMRVTDVAGYATMAYAQVQYLNKLFIFSSEIDYSSASDTNKSNAIKSTSGLLTNTRQASSRQNTQYPNNEYIYISYPVSFGGNPKIVINNFQDNSFTYNTFSFTNSDNYTEQYFLFKSANLLSSTYSVAIQ